MMPALLFSSRAARTGPLWTPASSIGALTLSSWHDIQTSSTVTQSGGTVSQVTDQGGGSRTWTQATGAQQPTYTSSAINGRPAITATGGASAVNMAWTMEAAIGNISAYHVTDTSTLRIEIGIAITGGGGPVNCDFTVDMTTAKHLVCVTDATADTVTLYANGSLVGTVSTPIILNAAFCWAGYIVSMGASDQPRYWAQNRVLNSSLGTRCLNGGLGSLLVYTAASPLTTADIDRLCGYGAWHWGMSLPSGHRYENAPPTV